MLNKVIISGRLVRAPERRATQDGTPVTQFTVAVERDFNRSETDFIDCTAWKQTAEFIAKNFSKGQQIIVNGHLQIRSWTDRNGNKRSSPEVVVETAYFAGRKDTILPDSVVIEDINDDAELPF